MEGCWDRLKGPCISAAYNKAFSYLLHYLNIPDVDSIPDPDLWQLLFKRRFQQVNTHISPGMQAWIKNSPRVGLTVLDFIHQALKLEANLFQQRFFSRVANLKYIGMLTVFQQVIIASFKLVDQVVL